MWRLRRAQGCLHRSRCWPAFAFLLGRPSICGCSAYGLLLCLPRRYSLRLLLFCTCPPLCAGALWPMPAWVWRDVRYMFFFSQAHVLTTQQQTDTILSTEQPQESDRRLPSSVNLAISYSMLTCTNSECTTALLVESARSKMVNCTMPRRSEVAMHCSLASLSN